MQSILLKIFGMTGSTECSWMSSIKSIRVDSWLPAWTLPFLAAVLVACAVHAYYLRREPSKPKRIALAAIRSLVYLTLLFMIASPSLLIDGEGSPPGIVPVLIDCSESMGIKDMDGKNRLECAIEAVSALEEAGKSVPNIKMKFYCAGKNFTEMNLEAKQGTKADADFTSLNRMADDIASLARGEYCPGAVIVGDGAHNTAEIPENAAKDLAKLNIPLYFCAVGKEKQKDVSVSYIMGDDVVFKDEKAKLFVGISQSGYAGSTVNYELMLADKKLLSGTHRFEKDGESSIPIEYVPDQAGVYQLKFSVEPQPGEVTLENNLRIKNVRVIDEKIKILLLFGLPSWEFRYLNGAMERDRRVVRKAFLLSADKRLFRKTDESSVFLQSLPEDQAEFNRSYDLVFISCVEMASIPEKTRELLRKFVEDDGGGMVIISDPTFIPFQLKGTALEDLLPISLGCSLPMSYREELLSPFTGEYSLNLTPDGLSQQIVAFSGDKVENARLWKDLPRLPWVYQAKRSKPSAICLVEAEDPSGRTKIPAIAYHSFGKGAVLYMGFDSTWRWRKEFGDRFFRDFWGRAVQFLALPHLLEESAASAIFTSKENFTTGEKISVRAKLSNPDFSAYSGDSVNLRIEDNDRKRTVKMQALPGRPGMFKAEFPADLPGKAVLSLDSEFSAKPIEILVVKQQREFVESAMNKALMEKLSAMTGGSFVPYEKASELPSMIWEKRKQLPIQARFSLWDSIILVSLALLLLSVEWLLRKLYNLD